MKTVLYLFLFTIFLTPLYLVPSGLPQISNFVFIFCFIILLFAKKGKLFRISKIAPKFIYFEYFILVAMVVNITWYTLYHDIKTLLAIFYFIYNYLILVVFFNLFLTFKDKIYKQIYVTLFFSFITLLFIAIFDLDYLFFKDYANDTGVIYRRKLSFNNPNQLGHWTLISISIMYMLSNRVLKENKKKFKYILTISTIICFYLSMISLSKASTISMIVLLFFNFGKSFKTTFIFILFAGLSFYIFSNIQGSFVDKYMDRLSGYNSSNDDNLEGRGYLRITNYPEYVFFGAGEGAIQERFNTDIEMHSSFGTILFSYGILGFILYLLFIFSFFRLNKLLFIKLLFPLLLFSLTHNGLRFSFFWLSLGMFYIISKQNILDLKLKKR